MENPKRVRIDRYNKITHVSYFGTRIAKLQSTNCLWVGGINSHAKKANIQKAFGQYGRISRIDFNSGDQYAYIMYEKTNACEDARDNLLGEYLDDGCSRRLRIDFADPMHFEKKESKRRANVDSRSRSVSRESMTPSSVHKRSQENDRKYLSKKIKTTNSNSRSPQRQRAGQVKRMSRSISPLPMTKKKTESISRSVSPVDNGTYEKAQVVQFINDAFVNKDVQVQRIVNVNEMNTMFKHIWNGVFTLKKISFPTKFFLLAGNRSLTERVLPSLKGTNRSNHAACLRITQRLRLDPAKVEELEDKLHDCNFQTQSTQADTCDFSVLIAVPNEPSIVKTSELCEGQIVDDDDDSDIANNIVNLNNVQQRSLHNLIIYLNQKSAAGVIPLPNDNKPTAMVHAFPPNCNFSVKLLKQLLPNLKISDSLNDTNLSYALNSDYMVIVLLISK